MASDPPPGSTFAERLDHLFRTVPRDPNKVRAAAAEAADATDSDSGREGRPSRSVLRKRGQRYSMREVAVALGMSHTHLGNLRSGSGGANDPRWSEIVALAKFFDRDVSYFVDVPEPERTRSTASPEHQLLRMARERPGVDLVLMRMSEADLSPAGAAVVASMIDQVARLEEAARRDQNSSPHEADGGGSGAA
jgi:transcriptional regulator with XRE-family HTH domain